MTGRTPAGPEVQYIRPNRKFERQLTPAEEQALKILSEADYTSLEMRTLASSGMSMQDFLAHTPWKKR